MAIQDKTLTAAEHDWFATRSGASTGAPLTEHKSKYFSNRGFGSNASLSKPITQQEREWLSSLPTVVPPANIGDADLWVRANLNFGVAPGKSVNESKFNFYTSVSLVTVPVI